MHLSAPPARAAGGERIGIVGGGMLGMTLALRLAERGRHVTLIESGSELGGLAAAWQIGEVRWDRHYHVTLASDARLRALLRDLGLESEIRWTLAQTGFYTDGRFYSMNNLVEFLRFPPLGIVDKLRLGLTIAYASRITDPERLESTDVESWLRRLSGNRTFERIWRPLLRAKLGERYRDASAAFIWAIIVRLYAARRAGLGAERFGYVPGGYARIIERFAARLENAGVDTLLGTRVASVRRQEDRIVVETTAGEQTFERVVVTANARIAARLCPQLDDDERSRLDDKVYGGIVCASLVLDRPLGPFYVTNITDEWVPFSAVIDMSAIVERREFGGAALAYLPKYVAPDDALFALDDASIETSFLAALERMYADFSPARVRAFRVSRVREVFALATPGYSKRLPPIATSVPGLYLVTSAHIVNATLNVNQTVGLAERALEIVDAPAPVRR